MSELTFSAALVARSFDTNANNQVQDNIQFNAAALAKVDADKNGQVSVAELTTAIENDAVVISNGTASVPTGKVKVANILGSVDALESANAAVIQAQEQLKPLQNLDSTRTNLITRARQRNQQLETGNTLYTAAINMSVDRWSGRTIKDDTYWRAVNGRNEGNRRIAANNALVQQVSGLSAAPLAATLQAKAREIYDIGVAMTANGPATSRSQIAQQKAQLAAISSTVAATGNTATEYATTLNNSHIQ